MTHHRKRSTRKTLSIIATIIILLVAIVMFSRLHRHAGNTESANRSSYLIKSPKQLKIDGVVLNKPRAISAFDLTADDGTEFKRTNLNGHWSLVFFGFTNCGYVCPTTLSAMNKMYTQLEATLPAQLLPEVILVSVDPERDSVQRIHDYVKGFNSHFIGVRGNLQQTKSLAQEMSVVFSKVKSPTGGDGYMVNHSAEVMLLDPNGDLRAFFSYPHEVTQMVRDYTAVVRAAGG